MLSKLSTLNKEILRTPLCGLGETHGTDKPVHGYTKVYYELMKAKRMDNVHLLEIGIFRGASLRMWESFFTNGMIYGIDNGRKVPNSNIKFSRRNETPSKDDKKLLKVGKVAKGFEICQLETNSIRCFLADQRSEEQLKLAFQYFHCTKYDYIIDDGQHYQEHQQKSLGLLFPHVKPGGYYIIEDVANHKHLLNGVYWGQKEVDASDSTDLVIQDFISSGELDSPYMTTKEMGYIENNVKDIFMFNCGSRNGSPITGTSKLIIIKKK